MPSFNRPDLITRIRTGLRIFKPYNAHIAEDIIPVVVVEDLQESLAVPSFPKPAWGRVLTGTPGVAEIPQCVAVARLFEGIVYRMTSAIVNKPTNGEVSVFVGSNISGLSESTAKAYSDLRDVGVPRLFLGSSEVSVTDGLEVGRFDVLALDSFYIPLDFILGATSERVSTAAFVNIVGGTQQEVLHVTYNWVEELLEDR